MERSDVVEGEEANEAGKNTRLSGQHVQRSWGGSVLGSPQGKTKDSQLKGYELGHREGRGGREPR